MYMIIEPAFKPTLDSIIYIIEHKNLKNIIKFRENTIEQIKLRFKEIISNYNPQYIITPLFFPKSVILYLYKYLSCEIRFCTCSIIGYQKYINESQYEKIKSI